MLARQLDTDCSPIHTGAHRRPSMKRRTASRLEGFLQGDLVANRYFMDLPDIPEDATPEEFAVFSRIEVLGRDALEVRFVEGPGFFACEDLRAVAEAAVERARSALPELAGASLKTVILSPEAAAAALPADVVEGVQRIAAEYLAEKRHFVSVIGEHDAERFAVLRFPLVSVVGPSHLAITWVTGPGFARIDPDMGAEGLTEEVLERIRTALPAIADYAFDLQYDEDPTRLEGDG
jgi:hypothetical protein